MDSKVYIIFIVRLFFSQLLQIYVCRLHDSSVLTPKATEANDLLQKRFSSLFSCLLVFCFAIHNFPEISRHLFAFCFLFHHVMVSAHLDGMFPGIIVMSMSRCWDIPYNIGQTIMWIDRTIILFANWILLDSENYKYIWKGW